MTIDYSMKQKCRTLGAKVRVTVCQTSNLILTYIMFLLGSVHDYMQRTITYLSS